MTPIPLQERLTTLDVLRGFALFGIIFVNIPALLQLTQPHTVEQHHYFYFLQIFVESKFFTIFSFLFGVGFFLFIDRAMKKGENGYVLFAKRLTILFGFGLVHFQFHPGEALTIYSICGFILLVAYKLPRRLNLIVGLILLTVFSWMTLKILMPLPLILLGIAAGQYNIFETVRTHYKKWAAFTALMAVGSVGIVAYQMTNVPTSNYFNHLSTISEVEIQKYVQLLDNATMSGPILSAFYVGVIVLLNETTFFAKLLKPLQFFGRMALTNYLAQTALILIIGNGIFANSALTYSQSGIVALTINILLISFSSVWLTFFKYGPMEKLWRLGTYYRLRSE